MYLLLNNIVEIFANTTSYVTEGYKTQNSHGLSYRARVYNLCFAKVSFSLMYA